MDIGIEIEQAQDKVGPLEYRREMRSSCDICFASLVLKFEVTMCAGVLSTSKSPSAVHSRAPPIYVSEYSPANVGSQRSAVVLLLRITFDPPSETTSFSGPTAMPVLGTLGFVLAARTGSAQQFESNR